MIWVAFILGVLLLLAADLILFGRKHGTRAALAESACWVAVSLAFNLWIWWHFGAELATQFLTGYLIEKSLSVDNLFVILLVFQSFKIPARYQHRVLFFGVLGAIVSRGAFILVGARLIEAFHWVMYIFGAILVYTAFRFLRESVANVTHEESKVVGWVRARVPFTHNVTSEKFFVIEAGRRLATPLLVALIVIEITDLIFAVDSIPAVFSITRDPFIAFSSNILALLGLRALYFVLADSVSKFKYLKPGLAGVLGFIGVKMLIADYVHISSWISLAVIAVILAVAAAFSVLA